MEVPRRDKLLDEYKGLLIPSSKKCGFLFSNTEKSYEIQKEGEKSFCISELLKMMGRVLECTYSDMRHDR